MPSMLFRLPWGHSKSLLAALFVTTLPTAIHAQSSDFSLSMALMDDVSKLSQATTPDPTQLQTTLHDSGFTIWNSGRKVTLAATPGNDLGLAITSDEIKTFGKMYQRGDRIPLSSYCAALEGLYQKLDMDLKFQPIIHNFVFGGMLQTKASVRNTSNLVMLLAGTHKSDLDTQFEDSATLDPIQVLVLTRMITETINAGIAKRLGPTEIFASITPNFQQGQGFHWSNYTSGTAQDFIMGMGSGASGLIIDHQLDKVGAHNPLSDAMSIGQVAVSLLKFMSTYAFLRGDISVVTPGEPLVRRKDKSPGEDRDLKAHLYFDAPAFMQALKDMRAEMALLTAGNLDTDVTTSGPLSGVEADWEIVGDRKEPSKHLVQWAPGNNPLRRVTDSNGDTTIKIQGAPRLVDISKERKIFPDMKSVGLQVSCQVKSNSLPQAAVDHITSLFGIASLNPLSFVNTGLETISRMRWSVAANKKLAIKDWKGATDSIDLEFSINGSGQSTNVYQPFAIFINRYLKLEDCSLTLVQMGGLKQVQITDDLIKSLPPEARKALEEQARLMKEMAGSLNGGVTGEGNVTIRIADVAKGIGVGCGEPNSDTKVETANRQFYWDENTPTEPRFELAVRLAKASENKPSYVAITANFLSHITIIPSRGKVAESDDMVGMGDGLTFLDYDETASAIKVNLEKKVEKDTGLEYFEGTTPLRVEFNSKQIVGKLSATIKIKIKLKPEESEQSQVLPTWKLR